MPPTNNFKRTFIALAVGQAMVQTELHAATITVNSNLDTDTSAYCTLRSAIEAINFDPNGEYLGCTAITTTNPVGTDDEILFNLPAGQEIITLNGESLNIEKPISLNPDGQLGISIDADSKSRVIALGGAASNTTINQLTLTGGSTVANGGAVYTNGPDNVTISNSTITGNTAGNLGGGVFAGSATDFELSNSSLTLNRGGGIYLKQTIDAQITDCVISDNTSASNGVGINMYQNADTVISGCLIDNNQTDTPGSTGGGMYVLYGTSNSLINSQVSRNYAGDGGGIYLQTSAGFSIVNSTINNNEANNKGGGLDAFNSNSISIVNSTISANSAPGGYGGGFYLDNDSAFGTILQSTIVDNVGDTGGGIYALRSIDISNTVVSDNMGGDCNGTIIGIGVANWAGDGSCDAGVLSGDPKLGPLKDNGGPTPTHSPGGNSGLNQAGDLTVCTDAPISGLDQRGEVRGVEACTIGSVEYIDDGIMFVVPLDGSRAVIFSL
jgi:hypothetical protein